MININKEDVWGKEDVEIDINRLKDKIIDFITTKITLVATDLLVKNECTRVS